MYSKFDEHKDHLIKNVDDAKGSKSKHNPPHMIRESVVKALMLSFIRNLKDTPTGELGAAISATENHMDEILAGIRE